MAWYALSASMNYRCKLGSPQAEHPAAVCLLAALVLSLWPGSLFSAAERHASGNHSRETGPPPLT